ncbi:MAG: hypothetical protein HKP58_05405 [Desulfatitalea sp.]|nr:hypothetical protein [Desulfatitalea sp.]NNJ99830.1 hypothetical protein [Desulfatitalea sp.]
MNHRLDHRRPVPYAKSVSMAPARWIPVLLLMGLLLSITVRWAGASGLALEAGDRWIKGQARQVPLTEVLGELSDQTGCSIYIDERLAQMPVTFDMPTPVPSEEAIRRIIHPYSNALVYVRVPGTQDTRIQQIKVFSESGQDASYVQVKGRNGNPVGSSYARGAGTTRVSRLLSNKAVSSGEHAVQEQVRPALTVERNALGLPSLKFRDKAHGPDYRPDAQAMRKSYNDYRRDRNALAVRTRKAAIRNGRQSAEQARAEYRQKRMASIQQSLQHSNAK